MEIGTEMDFINKIIDKIHYKFDVVGYLKKKGCIIGKDVEIYHSASFGSEPYLVRIGNHVRINEGVKFITHDGGVWVLRSLREEYKDIDLFGRIYVGDNVHIGTNAIIMPNVKIGSNVIIGCSAVVTKDIPDNSVVAGIPARVIKSITEYTVKNEKRFVHTKQLSTLEKRIFLENSDIFK